MRNAGSQIIDGRSILSSAITRIQNFSSTLSEATVTVVVPNAEDRNGVSAFVSSRQKRRAFQSVGFNFREVQENQIELRSCCKLEFVIVQRPLNSHEILRRFQCPIFDLDCVKPARFAKTMSAITETTLRIISGLPHSLRSEYFITPTTCVVGANGFFGSEIVKALLERQERTIPLDISDDLSQAREADVIISAVGKPELIKEKFLAPRPILLIDVGYSYDERTGVAYGDFDAAAYNRSMYYAPTPGGTGPLQILTLVERALGVMNVTQYEPWSLKLEL